MSRRDLIRVPLTYPLPEREWIRGPNGWWSREWTKERKRQALRNHFKMIPGNSITESKAMSRFDTILSKGKK